MAGAAVWRCSGCRGISADDGAHGMAAGSDAPRTVGVGFVGRTRITTSGERYRVRRQSARNFERAVYVFGCIGKSGATAVYMGVAADALAWQDAAMGAGGVAVADSATADGPSPGGILACPA